MMFVKMNCIIDFDLFFGSGKPLLFSCSSWTENIRGRNDFKSEETQIFFY